LTSLLLAPL